MAKQISKLNPFARRILHVISMIGTYMMLFGFFYLIQKYTLGFIPGLKNLHVRNMHIEPVLFTVLSILIIVRFFDVSSPYKKSPRD